MKHAKTPLWNRKFTTKNLSELQNELPVTSNFARPAVSRTSEPRELRRSPWKPVRGEETPPGSAGQGDFQTLKTATVGIVVLGIVKLLDPTESKIETSSISEPCGREKLPSKVLPAPSFRTTARNE